MILTLVPQSQLRQRRGTIPQGLLSSFSLEELGLMAKMQLRAITSVLSLNFFAEFLVERKRMYFSEADTSWLINSKKPFVMLDSLNTE